MLADELVVTVEIKKCGFHQADDLKVAIKTAVYVRAVELNMH
jgi:hypothetical protein